MHTFREALHFKDVLLVPKYADALIQSVSTRTELLPGIFLNSPYVSAAMDTVTDVRLAIALAQAGGVGVLPRSLNLEHQVQQIESIKKTQGEFNQHATLDEKKRIVVGCAIEPTLNAIDFARALKKAEVDFIVIDAIHGHTESVMECVKLIKRHVPDLLVIAGNVATKAAVKDLVSVGADGIKIGFGTGSSSITWQITAVGMPQLTALLECCQEANTLGIPTIADGGIESSSDIVKALAAGANAVMIGNLFAGCEESPSEIIFSKDQRYKSFRGMESLVALEQGSLERYQLLKEIGKIMPPEGIEMKVEYQGSIVQLVEFFNGALQRGMEYVGAENIRQLQQKAEFIKISYPHQLEKENHIGLE